MTAGVSPRAQSMMGAAQSGLGCAYSDVSPTYSSALNSVGNTVGALAGIVGPIVVSLCLGKSRCYLAPSLPLLMHVSNGTCRGQPGYHWMARGLLHHRGVCCACVYSLPHLPDLQGGAGAEHAVRPPGCLLLGSLEICPPCRSSGSTLAEAFPQQPNTSFLLIDFSLSLSSPLSAYLLS